MANVPESEEPDEDEEVESDIAEMKYGKWGDVAVDYRASHSRHFASLENIPHERLPLLSPLDLFLHMVPIVFLKQCVARANAATSMLNLTWEEMIHFIGLILVISLL